MSKAPSRGGAFASLARSPLDRMRLLTLINAALWCVLLVMWLPYALLMGFDDPASQQVMVILGVTAVLMIALGVYRMRRRRPILG